MQNGVCKVRRTTDLLQVRYIARLAAISCTRRYYSSDASARQHVAVLGSGITGLATAHWITKRLPRAKVTLFEASERLGGWLSSSRVPVSGGSILFEAGPRSLRPSGNGILTARLISDLGLDDELIITSKKTAAANHRYIYYPDRLVRMPHPSFGWFNVISTLLSSPIFEGLIRAVYNDVNTDGKNGSIKDQSIGDLLTQRFGSSKLVDRIVSAVFHGIYAGDVYQLSARSLLKNSWLDVTIEGGMMQGAMATMREGWRTTPDEINFMQEIQAMQPLVDPRIGTSSVFTFKEGIATLIDGLARSLWSNDNVELQTSSKVSTMRMAEDGTGIEIGLQDGRNPQKFSQVISTLSPAHLNALIEPEASRIPDVPTVTVMTVNLFYKKAEALPPGPGYNIGFGYLIPQATPYEQNPEHALGVVFDHAYAAPQISNDSGAERTSQDILAQDGTKLTVMLGGHWWTGWPTYPNEQEGLKMAQAVVARHLGIMQEPEAFQVNLQKDCIPQYTVGHEDRLKTAHSNLWQAYKGKVRVAGSWISGVGVNDCLRSAWDVVRRLEDGLDGTGLELVGSGDIVRVKTVRARS